MMKLKDLQHVICTDLALNDMRNDEFYCGVPVYSETFEKFKDYEVVSIRDHTASKHVIKGIVISIR